VFGVLMINLLLIFFNFFIFGAPLLESNTNHEADKIGRSTRPWFFIKFGVEIILLETRETYGYAIIILIENYNHINLAR